MRTALFAALLTLPTIAFAQDASAPPAKRPTGTSLLDALPPQADVVVDAPDLPALLDSMSAAGLGDAAAWRAAFEAQLRAWAADGGDPEKLVRGGDALLAAADGEALAASFSLKLPDTRQQRATLLAMRSTKDEATLRAAFTDLIDGGLKQRYLGDARQEEIAGRRVHVLYGNQGNLFIHVSNGFVAVSDHPLALGLFFKGFAKDPAPAPESRPGGASLKLVVHRGRGDAAWDGWIWGEGETVEWKAGKAVEPRVPTGFPALARAALIVSADRMADVAPLLFAPPPERMLDRECDYVEIGEPVGGEEIWSRMQKGASSDAMYANIPKVVGGAARLVWLRMLGTERAPAAFAGIGATLLRGPYDSAAKAAGAKVGEFLPWKSTHPGRLSGPLGHGPATFLALRCLHDIGHGTGPGEAAAPPPEPPAPAAPLPPPTEPRDK